MICIYFTELDEELQDIVRLLYDMIKIRDEICVFHQKEYFFKKT